MHYGHIIAPTPSFIPLPDPKDRIYLDAAVTAQADAIITGNVKHYPQVACPGIDILTLRDFLQRVGA
ncbi:MAG: hypothetical protein HQL56_00740 [Magnetococcales bacterium]|nr:hypothetical protein [Magnetococcales bacterium]